VNRSRPRAGPRFDAAAVLTMLLGIVAAAIIATAL
jgi:hypothetical protein